MKKVNLKKIALMGVAGMLVSAPAVTEAREISISGQEFAFASCGGQKSYDGNSWDGNNQGSSNGCAGRSAPRQNSCSAISMGDQTSTAQIMTESDLLPQLNEAGKADYMRLDTDGKYLARKIASKYTDKNEAVRAAAQKMSQMRK